jgi:hypothetical protein
VASNYNPATNRCYLEVDTFVPGQPASGGVAAIPAMRTMELLDGQTREALAFYSREVGATHAELGDINKNMNVTPQQARDYITAHMKRDDE